MRKVPTSTEKYQQELKVLKWPTKYKKVQKYSSKKNQTEPKCTNKYKKTKEIYERGSKKYQWEQVQLIAQLGDLCYCLFGISQPHDR